MAKGFGQRSFPPTPPETIRKIASASPARQVGYLAAAEGEESAGPPGLFICNVKDLVVA
jgi:hypothetical protein